ncbi:MAG: hypothetical protein R2780_15020 [Crocinitomicaceae bacterium]|nr:hypothetical protein [Crocinitomicaceae bacterium]
MSTADGRKVLLETLKRKSGHKQDVFQNTKEWFYILKKVLQECIDELSGQLGDDRIRFRVEDQGLGEARLYLGSDVLVFHMHSNVFKLPPTDYATQTSYVKNKPENAYCGIINVYDFLADSYEQNRPNDLGYLICRIFVNKEDHFKVEGKGPLGIAYQNYMNQVLTEEILHELILRIGIYALDFDLLTPPYQAVSTVSVEELQTLSSHSKLRTGKRLGFRFHSDNKIQG